MGGEGKANDRFVVMDKKVELCGERDGERWEGVGGARRRERMGGGG